MLLPCRWTNLFVWINYIASRIYWKMRMDGTSVLLRMHMHNRSGSPSSLQAQVLCISLTL
jgi:hypothetical protein